MITFGFPGRGGLQRAGFVTKSHLCLVAWLLGCLVARLLDLVTSGCRGKDGKRRLQLRTNQVKRSGVAEIHFQCRGLVLQCNVLGRSSFCCRIFPPCCSNVFWLARMSSIAASCLTSISRRLTTNRAISSQRVCESSDDHLGRTRRLIRRPTFPILLARDSPCSSTFKPVDSCQKVPSKKLTGLVSCGGRS